MSEAAEFRRALVSADTRLSRYNPLPRILFFDDFDEGVNGWCELIGSEGFFPGDDFRLGFLMLGPHRHYSDHYHPAPELYWPLTGPSDWKKGAGGFETRQAGEVIWHPPLRVHATKTGNTPLLAVWSWTREAGTPARLVTS